MTFQFRLIIVIIVACLKNNGDKYTVINGDEFFVVHQYVICQLILNHTWIADYMDTHNSARLIFENIMK